MQARRLRSQAWLNAKSNIIAAATEDRAGAPRKKYFLPTEILAPEYRYSF